MPEGGKIPPRSFMSAPEPEPGLIKRLLGAIKRLITRKG